MKILRTSIGKLLSDERQKLKKSIPEVDETFWKDEPIFCSYQNKVCTDKSRVILIEKSRQIGMSYCLAYLAVFKAITDTKGTVVSSYNRDAVKNFISDCAKWAKIFNNIFSVTTYTEIINKKELCVFEIKFLNGRRIIGLAGDSVQFRSYTGANYDAIVDEAAYRDDLQSLLAAVLGLLIHGGQVIILSTHAGVDNEFNKLCEKVKQGELPYSHYKITFREAIEQGLYKRICAKSGDEYTKEKEKDWIQSIYDLYGVRATEELDVVPSDYSQEGLIFNNFVFIESLSNNSNDRIYFRSYDIASTEDDKKDSDTAYYTASIKLAYIFTDDNPKYVIVDWFAEKLAPLEADKKIIETAIEDGDNCHVILEQEPGSGEKYIAIMKNALAENGIYNVYGYKPYTEKLKRAIPVANAAKYGKLAMIENPHNRELEKILRRVSKHRKPLVQDLCDALSNFYDYIENHFNSLYS